MINKDRLENLTQEVWNGAIRLRGRFKAKDYPSIILPMIMIRRVELVLEEKRKGFKDDILANSPDIDGETLHKRIKIMEQSEPFYNTSNWTLKGILNESPAQVETNFREYINSYSPNIDEIIDKFNYRYWVTEMAKAHRLTSIIQLAAEEDFSPQRLSNIEMGYVYENLLQLFSQDDAKDTGEHFTPREIIRIMVDLMEVNFDPEKATKAITIYDPACGTGGMLSISKEHILDKATTKQGQKNVEDLVLLNGQEMLAQNYALCRADMILKGEIHSNITQGNSIIPHIESIQEDGDQHASKQYDYMISNPPFGVNWSEYKKDAERLNTSRYVWGMPPIDDGALLFLLTMIEKMKPKAKGGSKIAILFNGSPLSNGDATQNESEIRRNILENDLLDTIVMLPDQMFYNTGIYTYIWLLNNNKPGNKKDKVQIINARNKFEKEPKSFGNKRNFITKDHRAWIQSQFEKREESEESKLFHTKDFAFHKVKVVFWQEDENGEQMWITEPFTVQLNNGNAKKRLDLYGDMTFYIAIDAKFKTENRTINIEVVYDGSKAFETMVAEQLKSEVPELKDYKANELKAWFKNQYKTADYNHRHYIEDNEYIPYNRAEKDKEAYINSFLAKEIDYEIISWEEYDQLGYEILPNKYFYKYKEPTPSDELIKEFWKLEEDAIDLLNEIRGDVMGKYEYKETGIEWLGEIPKHWTFDRLKDTSDLRDEKTTIKSEELNYLELEDIEQGTGKIFGYRDTLEVASAVMKFEKGDVLFGKLRPYLEKYYYADIDGLCTGEILAIEPKRVYGKFLYYFVGSPNFIKQCNVLSYGTKMPRVNWNTQISIFNIPLPPPLEQKAIADYLDKACHRIDKIIEIKERQLEKIENYFFSRLDEMLTCKKNKKESSQKYNGFINRNVPNKWKIDRLRDVAIINEEALKSGTSSGFTFNYLDIGNVNRYGIIDIDNIKELNFETAPSRARRITKKYDTVISSVRTNLQAVAFIDNDIKNLISSTGFFVCRPKFTETLMSKFLYYFLLTVYSKDYFFSLSTGVSYPAIGDYSFGGINIFLPPIEEQKVIVEHLDKLKLKINSVTELLNSQITTLQSYRKSLIHECVTGKKQVWEGR